MAYYDVYGVFRGVKLATIQTDRLARAYQVRHFKPESMTLGNSLASFLDPTHDAFAGLRNMKATVPAGVPSEVYRYFYEGVAAGQLQQGVIDLDFRTFYRPKTYAGATLRESAFRLDIHGNPKHRAKQRIDFLHDAHLSLFSRDAMYHVINYYRKVGRLRATHANDNGRAGKYKFSKPKKQLASSFLINRDFCSAISENKDFATHRFRELLAIARANHIRLRLFQSPLHAHLVSDILDNCGEEYFSWLRFVVSSVAEDTAAHPEDPLFEVWDFSLMNNAVTTEPFQWHSSTGSVMHWYQDGAHYTSETGDLVLDRLLRHSSPERTVPDTFGVLLTPQNIDEHLRNHRLHYEQYMEILKTRGELHPQDQLKALSEYM